MNWKNLIIVFAIIFFVVISVSIILKPNNHPEFMLSMSGCYGGAGPASHVSLSISTDGVLKSKNDATNIIISEDKIGLYMLPSKNVTFDYNLKKELVFTNDYPLKIRIDELGRSFNIYSSRGNIYFKKKSC